MNHCINNSPSKLEVVLAVKHLTKKFKCASSLYQREVNALSNVSLSLHKGRALALVGESGSGKSTLAKIIMKMHVPCSGEVTYAGKSILGPLSKARILEYRQCVQMIFQDPFSSLNPVHRVFHHLARPLLRHRKIANKALLEDKVFEYLRQVDLEPEITAFKFPYELSGGQRQRVALARTLAVGAKVILADEPVSMLDAAVHIDILDLLTRIKNDRGTSFLYITHDITSASYFAEDIAIIYDGQIVEWGILEQVIDNPQHDYTKLLLAAVPDAKVRFDRISKEQAHYINAAKDIRFTSSGVINEVHQISTNHYVRVYHAK